MLLGDELGDVVEIGVEQRFELEKILHALDGRHLFPLVKSRLRRPYGEIDIGCRAQRATLDLLRGGRVEDGDRLATG